ncbi:MAG: hypothetical protein PHU73_03215 [Patescibacteria group bacterium]|nr:hypothetical protein [Patescibacteria group bacterium]
MGDGTCLSAEVKAKVGTRTLEEQVTIPPSGRQNTCPPLAEWCFFVIKYLRG